MIDRMDAETPSAELLSAVEAILMVADAPVTLDDLSRVLEIGEATARQAVVALSRDYDGLGEGENSRVRGFQIRQAAGGYRLFARAEHREIVERFVLSGQKARLSQAALETLAVIAYRQPVARSQVAAIRGVNVDSVIKTLQHRSLIEEVGTHAESGATLYGTTQYFLERIGLDSLGELPKISPHLPGLEDLADVESGEAVEAARDL